MVCGDIELTGYNGYKLVVQSIDIGIFSRIVIFKYARQPKIGFTAWIFSFVKFLLPIGLGLSAYFNSPNHFECIVGDIHVQADACRHWILKYFLNYDACIFRSRCKICVY